MCSRFFQKFTSEEERQAHNDHWNQINSSNSSPKLNKETATFFLPQGKVEDISVELSQLLSEITADYGESLEFDNARIRNFEGILSSIFFQ